MKFIKYFLISILALVTFYLLGPKPDYPAYDLKPLYLKHQIKNLDKVISEKEATIQDLKPDNEARVVWYNDSIQVTDYSLVYLHGFSSSQEEGDPVHREYAQRYGMNMYLSRLADHGRSSKETFKGLTPKDLIDSAKEAIAIGGLIGKKVILMSCSTGGTYSFMLAPSDPRVAGILTYSPNIEVADKNAKLVTYPWGKSLLKQVMGGEYVQLSYPPLQEKYWNTDYHIDGILALQSLLDDGMREEIFSKVTQPVLLGAYYKDEEHQDNVVSVAAMKDAFDQLGTAKDQKILDLMPDVGRHVFTSHVTVDDFSKVQTKAYSFTEEVLGIKPTTDL